MKPSDRLRSALSAAVTGAGTGLAAADSLCRSCVDLLPVDGAAISLVLQGRSRGTYGSSGELSQRLDSYQFTYGEGPCLDAVRTSTPVLVADLDDTAGQRWPAFTASMRESGIHAVFALPVAVASATVGALDLFCRTRGPLAPDVLSGALLAAHLAALPVLDLVQQVARRAAAGIVEGEQEDPWEELESLERTEVYQATGMLIAQGGLTPAEALVRLRGRAYAAAQSASEVAWQVIERRLSLDAAGSWHHPTGPDRGGARDPGGAGHRPGTGAGDPHRRPEEEAR